MLIPKSPLNNAIQKLRYCFHKGRSKPKALIRYPYITFADSGNPENLETNTRMGFPGINLGINQSIVTAKKKVKM
jgi:hypothetical protein